jgi:hypothetical protein
VKGVSKKIGLKEKKRRRITKGGEPRRSQGKLMIREEDCASSPGRIIIKEQSGGRLASHSLSDKLMTFWAPPKKRK